VGHAVLEAHAPRVNARAHGQLLHAEGGVAWGGDG
jgi:hypothetical protein